MTSWPKNPAIYEIDTWAWLQDLSRRWRHPVTLADVPPDEWDTLAEYRFDAVWLMGVWERSPRGALIAREHPGLQAEYRRALPDYTPEDVVGSPYSVHAYRVAEELGGPDGLRAARQALALRGIRLILDYVPNHVAIDHPWTLQHPEYFIQGSFDDLERQPDSFFGAGSRVIANARDPYFPAWTDSAQLNAFHPGLRAATVTMLKTLAHQCDGVRCDMAMLLTNRIFAGTWGERAGIVPETEFWTDVIGAVRAEFPDCLFVAEAYWDMEWELQQQGFDFCYDKRLYDRLAHEAPATVRDHLRADLAYQNKLVRFIENHDEPRAAAVFSRGKERAAALLSATLPGARLFHEGQFEGRQVRLPVQLARRLPEPIDGGLRAFYRTLLAQIAAPVFHEGEWTLCDVTGWDDNPTAGDILAHCWRLGETHWLIVVNLGEGQAQARVRLPWGDLGGAQWTLSDPFNGDVFQRDGDEMRDPGLYVGLAPHGAHFLKLERAS